MTALLILSIKIDNIPVCGSFVGGVELGRERVRGTKIENSREEDE